MKAKKVIAWLAGGMLGVSVLTGSLVASDISNKNTIIAKADVEDEEGGESETIVEESKDSDVSNSTLVIVDEPEQTLVIEGAGGEFNNTDFITESGSGENNPEPEVIVEPESTPTVSEPDTVIESEPQINENINTQPSTPVIETEANNNLDFDDNVYEQSESESVENKILSMISGYEEAPIYEGSSDIPQEIEVENTEDVDISELEKTIDNLQKKIESLEAKASNSSSSQEVINAVKNNYYEQYRSLYAKYLESLYKPETASTTTSSTSRSTGSYSGGSSYKTNLSTTPTNNSSQLASLQNAINMLQSQNDDLAKKNAELEQDMDALRKEVENSKYEDNNLFDSFNEDRSASYEINTPQVAAVIPEIQDIEYLDANANNDNFIISLTPQLDSIIEGNSLDEAYNQLEDISTVSTITKSNSAQNAILSSILICLMGGSGAFVYLYGRKQGWFNKSNDTDLDDFFDEDEDEVHLFREESEEELFNQGYGSSLSPELA